MCSSDLGGWKDLRLTTPAGATVDIIRQHRMALEYHQSYLNLMSRPTPIHLSLEQALAAGLDLDQIKSGVALAPQQQA